VDQFDKHCLRDNFSLEKSQVSRKWWHKLYWGLFDSALVNSFILYEKYQGKMAKYEFMLRMQDEMLHFNHPKDGPNVGIVTRRTPQKSDKDRFSGSHIIVKEESAERRGCVVCLADQKHKRLESAKIGVELPYKKCSRTSYRCLQCDVPLCVHPCFKIFHEDGHIAGLDYGVEKIKKKLFK
jgi:hypothetical protein